MSPSRAILVNNGPGRVVPDDGSICVAFLGNCYMHPIEDVRHPLKGVTCDRHWSGRAPTYITPTTPNAMTAASVRLEHNNLYTDD